MGESFGDLGIRDQNRIKVMEYLTEHGSASRLELSQKLKFSMPTVFQIVSELIEQGVVCEDGEYDSTGGRRAKKLTVCPEAFCTVGVVASKNHIGMVLMDFAGAIIDNQEVEAYFEDTPTYYRQFDRVFQSFVCRKRGQKIGRMLCVGIVMPGTVEDGESIVRKCFSLGVSEVSLHKFEQVIGMPIRFVSTKYAVLAEMENKGGNVLYLGINDEIDGSAYLNGKVYIGAQNRSMRFGHTTLVPGGRPCYCGRKGCVQAYCSAAALESSSGKSLEVFFDDLEAGDEQSLRVWDEYLDYLSVMVCNLRMIFDCQIILGGKVGSYLGKRLELLEQKILQNNPGEKDISFVVPGRCRKGLYAAGAARRVLECSIREGRFYQKDE